VRSCANKVGILVCLRGGWQECAEVAKRAKLACHHALEVRSHLWVVRDISSWDLLVVVSCGGAVLLLSVMAALRGAPSVVVIVVVV
jgi:hypothetical protein